MQIKTGIAFQETIRQLQTSKLKLPDNFLSDSNHKTKRRIFIDENINESEVNIKRPPRREIITMVNTLRNSLKKDSGLNSTVSITMDKGEKLNFKNTSVIKLRNGSDSGDHVLNFLYGVESPRDNKCIFCNLTKG
jgi:regulator of replication initiation timing